MKRIFFPICIIFVLLLNCNLFADSPTPDYDVGHVLLHPAQNEDGTINAFIEIPAGTNEKWEYSLKTNQFTIDRVVNYLGYPCNYGMIPQTVLSKSRGGDGDPVDILVLGGPLERASIAKVKMIGLLKMVDRGEIDYKIIAVLPGTGFEKINSMEKLIESFPGSVGILSVWFSNYKGPGKIVVEGPGSLKEAEEFLTQGIEDFKKEYLSGNLY